MKRLAAHLILFAFLALSGCGAVDLVGDPAPDGAEQAYALAWASFGPSPGPTPAVVWAAPRECPGGAPGWAVSGTCASGYTEGPGLIFVGRWEGEAMALTALVHELCHAWAWQAEGDPDHDHLGPCFSRGGKVERAQADLAKLEGIVPPMFVGKPPP